MCAADIMLVAPCERTTTGRGCLLGRGPAVRVAGPEEADPQLTPGEAMPKGAAMWSLLVKLLLFHLSDALDSS